MDSAPPKRRPRAAILLLLGFVGAALVASTAGCSSLAKSELETRLLALGKNAPAAEAGFLSRPLEFDGEVHDLRYLMVRANTTAAERDPVVLVHGTPSTATSWVEIMHGVDGEPGLARSRDVYAIEVIGHGIGPDAEGEFGFETCARYVSAAVRALGLTRVHLVGSSYGGEFAWRAALNEPDLYASLTLLDSSGYERREGDFLPEEVDMREISLAKIGWLLNSQDRITTALEPHFPVVPPDRVEEFFLVCENANNWGAMIDLVRDENGTREGELAELSVPTLIIWGENDIAYPLDVYGKRFHNDITGAVLATLPTGHYPHEQQPAKVIELLDGFYANLDS